MAKNKMILWGVVIVVIIIVAAIAVVVIMGGEESVTAYGEYEKVVINGKTYTPDELSDFEKTTVTGPNDKSYEGYVLSELVEDSGMTNPESKHYVLEAADGYAMAVNWTSMQNGIMAPQVDDETNEKYMTTVFPELPKGYMVKYLATITPADLVTFNVAGLEYTLDYLPKQVDVRTVQHNETVTYEGASLSDMVNYSGLDNPENYNYTIMGSDEYNVTVNWTVLQTGIIIEHEEDNTMTYFPNMAKKYYVTDVVSILPVNP
jgi:hypothetical protein